MNRSINETELYDLLRNADSSALVHLCDPRLLRDIWIINEDLPVLIEDAYQMRAKTINFEKISLKWLKDLLKISIILFTSNRRWSLGHITSLCSSIKYFNNWLVAEGYFVLSTLNTHVVQKWLQIASYNQGQHVARWFGALKRVGILQIEVSLPSKQDDGERRIIPENVKYQIDLSLSQLDQPVFTAFKLHEALGTRSIEIPRLKINCLRHREGIAKIRIPTGKQNSSEKEQDLPKELVPLVHEQQKFVRERFDSDFPWLFSNWAINYGCKKVWPPKFEYYPEQLRGVSSKMNLLLEKLIEENNICESNGNLAHVTSHDFRRTYGTVADAMGKRPDQIQHGLRQLNSNAQDPYVQTSPQVHESRIERVLVDKDGKSFVYQTDQHSEFLRIEWRVRQVELGVCSRPKILENCEFEYVCLDCPFFRASFEHLPKLLEVRHAHQQLLEIALRNGQSNSRRANSARQLIEIISLIIEGLNESTKVAVE